MTIEQLEKSCNTKYNLKDFRSVLYKVIEESRSAAIVQGMKYYRRFYEPLTFDYRRSSEEEFYLKILPEDIKLKNDILELMQNPFFPIVENHFRENDKMIDRLIIHFYFYVEPIEFDLNYLEKQLTELFFILERYKNSLKAKSYAASILTRVDVLESEYFEARYVNLLSGKIEALEKGYISHDFSLNLDDRSVSLLYYFLREEKLLPKDLLLVTFFKFLQRGNLNKIPISLKGRRFTNKDIGYFWAKLSNYYYPDSKREYLKWLNDNFVLLTKQDNEKQIDDIFHKDYINQYKNDQDSLSENMERVNLLFRDIKNYHKILEADIYGGKD